MELQEPVLHSVSLSVGWRIPPRFPDVRGEITDLLLETTGDPDRWMWRGDSDSRPYVTSWSDEDRIFLIAATEGLDIYLDRPDVETVEAALSGLVDPCLQILNLDSLDGYGSGAIWLLAAEDRASAEKGFEQWLFDGQFRNKLEAVGGRPDELELDLVFGRGSDTRTLLSAEVFSDESLAEDGPFLSEFEATDFPPGALVVDLKRQHDGEFDSAKGVADAIDQLRQLVDHGETLLATVSGDKNGTNS